MPLSETQKLVLFGNRARKKGVQFGGPHSSKEAAREAGNRFSRGNSFKIRVIQTGGNEYYWESSIKTPRELGRTAIARRKIKKEAPIKIQDKPEDTSKLAGDKLAAARQEESARQQGLTRDEFGRSGNIVDKKAQELQALANLAPASGVKTRSFKDWTVFVSERSPEQVEAMAKRLVKAAEKSLGEFGKGKIKEIRQDSEKRQEDIRQQEITARAKQLQASPKARERQARDADSRLHRKTSSRKGEGNRNPELDKKITATRVAPAIPKTKQDMALQREWFEHPNRLDFEGIDTNPNKPPRARKMRTRKL